MSKVRVSIATSSIFSGDKGGWGWLQKIAFLSSVVMYARVYMFRKGGSALLPEKRSCFTNKNLNVS